VLPDAAAHTRIVVEHADEAVFYASWENHPTESAARLLQDGFPASIEDASSACSNDYPGMSCGVWQHRPRQPEYVRRNRQTSSSIRRSSNYLSHEVGSAALIGGIGLARRLLGTPQLSRFVDCETFPGDGVRTDDEVLHWARQYGGTVWHLVGTCRMGPATESQAWSATSLESTAFRTARD